MKSVVVTAKNEKELKFLTELLDKLGFSSSSISEEELEDLGLSMMMRRVNKSKRVSRDEVIKKLKFSS